MAASSARYANAHNGPLEEAALTPEARRPADEVAHCTQKSGAVRGEL
jgi:hypothetical protein